jgi:hypothetical protein
MKSKYPLLVALVATVALLGCEPPNKPNYPDRPNPPTLSDRRDVPASKPYIAPSADVDTDSTAPGLEGEMKSEIKDELTETPLPPEATQPPEGPKPEVAVDRDHYLASMDEKLRNLDQQVKELRESVEAAQEDQDARNSLDAYHNQRSRFGEKFDEFKRASKDAWSDMKAGLESAMDELERAYEDLKAKYGS